jgi:hypothetical protein
MGVKITADISVGTNQRLNTPLRLAIIAKLLIYIDTKD